MGTTTRYMYSKRDLEYEADHVKALVVAQLVKDKLLDAEIAHKWCEEHTLILRAKRSFRSVLGSLLGIKQEPVDKDGMLYIVIKDCKVGSQTIDRTVTEEPNDD